MNSRLIEFLTPESRATYISWMNSVEKQFGEGKKEKKGGFLPVFWMIMHVDFLLEIKEELPSEVRDILEKVV